MQASSTCTILLTPRRWSTAAGKLALVPLLPEARPRTGLPFEIWARVFEYLFKPENGSLAQHAWRRSLARVSRLFKSLADPYIYSCPPLPSINVLHQFTLFLNDRDKRPIGLDRIPYSLPGRWIQTIDLSRTPCDSSHESLLCDTSLASLFAMTPSLSTLILGRNIRMSRRALQSLADSDCVPKLRQLTGLQPTLPFIHCRDSLQVYEDPVIRLLELTRNLEILGLVGPGTLPDVPLFNSPADWPDVPKLHLPKLHHLSVIGLFTSAVILSMASSRLPSLRSLTVTRFDHIPPSVSFVPALMTAHADAFKSLHFVPPHHARGLPTHPDASLQHFSQLTYLSLSSISPILPPIDTHPLQCLCIPRPTPSLLSVIESILPKLPRLYCIIFADVRWLPATINVHARASGVQGEMVKWQRRLIMRGIKVVDADGKSA